MMMMTTRPHPPTGHAGTGHHRDARQRSEAREARGLPRVPVCTHAQVLAEKVSRSTGLEGEEVGW